MKPHNEDFEMARKIDDMKEHTWMLIREMQERHRQELAPLIKILSDLQALEPPPPMFIDYTSLTDTEKDYWS